MQFAGINNPHQRPTGTDILLATFYLLSCNRRTTSAMSKAHQQFNEDLYNKTLSDPRVSLETVYTSLTGIRIATTTASVSTLASILLIFFRSQTKMGSVYHRIMFGMSFFDIVQSLAMAFTTLPMPTDMIYDQFKGLIIGTENSCKAQGFMYIIGSMAATTYNEMLCLFYLSALHFNLQMKVSEELSPRSTLCHSWLVW